MLPCPISTRPTALSKAEKPDIMKVIPGSEDERQQTASRQYRLERSPQTTRLLNEPGSEGRHGSVPMRFPFGPEIRRFFRFHPNLGANHAV
jgi:hypothetical protein